MKKCRKNGGGCRRGEGEMPAVGADVIFLRRAGNKKKWSAL